VEKAIANEDDTRTTAATINKGIVAVIISMLSDVGEIRDDDRSKEVQLVVRHWGTHLGGSGTSSGNSPYDDTCNI